MNEQFLKDNGINVDQGLEIFGDLEIYNETMVDFLEEQKDRIPELIKYKEAGDTQNYAILAHAMKSDSKYLGFTKLIELAYNHELKGKENDINYINDNFDALMEEANRINSICQKYLNK